MQAARIYTTLLDLPTLLTLLTLFHYSHYCPALLAPSLDPSRVSCSSLRLWPCGRSLSIDITFAMFRSLV